MPTGIAPILAIVNERITDMEMSLDPFLPEQVAALDHLKAVQAELKYVRTLLQAADAKVKAGTR